MKKKRNSGRQSAKGEKNARKIRIGYLSSDFGGGRTRDLLPVFFSSYDKLRFTVYAYHTGTGGDTELFEKAVSLRELDAMSVQAAADVMRRDGLDLLVDLSLRAPDAMTREIMALRPARHIVSLAADCPTGLAEVLPAVEGKAVLAHCYTPVQRVHDYTYRTPLLDAHVPTIGITGMCTEDLAERLVALLRAVLQHIPAVRLILPAVIAAALTEVDIARIAEAGTEDAALELVDDLPYDVLDLVTAVDVDLVDVCHASEHSVPLVTAEAYVHGAAAARVLTQLGLAPVRAAACLGAEISRLCTAVEDLSELHHALHWQLYDLFDAEAQLFSLERAYDRILVQDCRETEAELAALLAHADPRTEQETVLAAAHALDGMEALTPEQRMGLAWCYLFADTQVLAERWALLAEGVPPDREAARIYLSVISTTGQGTAMERFARAKHGLDRIAQGLPAVPEIREALIKVCAGAAELSVGAQAASAYAELYAETAENVAAQRCYYGVSLFHLNAVDLPAAEVYRRSCRYGTLFSDVKQFSHRGRKKKEKIRVGYISGDFRQHVMQYFIWPFLAGFGRDAFEVYVYNLGKEDQYSAFFRTLVTKWRDMRPYEKDMRRIAHAIYDDAVDILFDLAGHTAGSGLAALAWKPAPIQISGLGYMATTGLPAVDYFVTDNFCDPPGNERFYVEKLLRLTSQFCYNGYTNLPASQGTPARTRGYVVFATFNQYVKLRDDTLLAWREIMERVPHSRLLLKNSSFGKRGIALAAQERFRQLGFDLNRVMFEEATRDYMLRYLDVDIALDTFPWPGGGTTCDALYMGVPVVSYYTERHSTRFTYSLLANVGLSDLASERMEDYVETAVALANDPGLLDALHRELRDRMKASPVMDQAHYIHEMEGCYRAIWAQWEAQEEDL